MSMELISKRCIKMSAVMEYVAKYLCQPFLDLVLNKKKFCGKNSFFFFKLSPRHFNNY